MKLALALTERSDLQKRLDQLEDRLQSNALVQEGETPAEDPASLLAELDTLTGQLTDLITRINLTNANTVADGLPLTAWLARRDCLTQKIRRMRHFLNTASQTAMRSRGSEIKIRPTVPVRELQKGLDDLSRELREIDARIQEANWSTDLL